MFRSPMVLGTIAVIVIAAVILGVVTLVNQKPAVTADTLRAPGEPAPAALQNGHTLGKADAKVTVDVWEDFQCPNCDNFVNNIEPRLVNLYVTNGTAKLVYHDFSFLGLNSSYDESTAAAIAADCADQQGKFWPYMEYLYANQGTENTGTFNKTMFDAIAQKLGLDVSKFETCRADPSGTLLAGVNQERATAQSLGLTGTPSVIVNGTVLLSYSLDSVSAAIEAAAAGKPIPGGVAASAAPGASEPPVSTPAASK